MTAPETLVIFDYSGTLSLEASRFAQPERLVRELEDTGLAALGIGTPEIFWNAIVGPTWVEGSTTQAGYRKVMAQRIAALQGAAVPQERIDKAAARFVKRYFEASRIDPHWRTILAELNSRPAVVTIIATDHYAEATPAIIGFLRSWSIDACPVSPRQGPHLRAASRTRGGQKAPRFFVANSADLGVWKANDRFWEILKQELSLMTVRSVLVIDDFGVNEEAGDPYGEEAKIAARREATLVHLAGAFQTAAEAIFFCIEGKSRDKAGAARLIGKAAAQIRAFVERQ